MSEFSSSTPPSTRPFNFYWQQTMLRIKDPSLSIPFYCNNFGFKQIMHYVFPQWNFSLYFLVILPEKTNGGEGEGEGKGEGEREGNLINGVDVDRLVSGTAEAEDFLWSYRGVVLELTHNYGSESDPNFKVNNGNVEPYRGFGHIALMCRDVYRSCEILEERGVKFQKKPDEGKMKGLAFALDPDGYWIEIIKRNETSTITNEYTFAQTMIRVKDPVKSLHFYRDLLGMQLLSEKHLGVGESWGFSLYFLADIDADRCVPQPPMMGDIFEPVLELTHNHGTEKNELFKYHNGNDTDEGQLRGFGHIGFLVDDLEKACEWLEERGVVFKKKPSDGNMRSIAFVYDPDNYWVEIIQKNGFKLLSA